MNKVPGLTRQDDRPSVGGGNRGRVQVRDSLPNVALQPQARPVDTYSRPQAPNSGPSELAQLAGALAQVSPALHNYMETSAATYRKEAEDRAMRRIGGMSFEEARAAVEGGKIPEMQNPWYKAAFMKQYGERMAYERVNELSQRYETDFDKNSGSVDAMVREQASKDLEQFGSDPHFSDGYGKVINQFGQQANTAQAKYQTEQIKQDTISGVYDTFLGKARLLAQEGKSPSEIAAALRGNYEGNRKLLHVDFKEQDREMVRVAEAFANEGNLAMAKAILQDERVGSDGTKLGSLGSNREFQADANRILNSAKAKLYDQNEEHTRDRRMDFWDQARLGQLNRDELLAWHKSNPGSFSEAQVRSLIQESDTFNERQAEEANKIDEKYRLKEAAKKSEEDVLTRNLEAAGKGMLPYIEPVEVLTDTGKTKTVSVEDQKKDVAKRIVDQTEYLVEKKKASPEQAFGMQVESFSADNLVNPKWANVLQAGPKAATQFNLSGGEVPPALKDSVDLYMKLHAANPKLLETHIKDSSDRNFYESYRIATQYAKLAPAQAMQMAMMQTSDPDKFQSSGTQQRFQDIDSRVKDINFGGLAGWFTNTPKNQGYVANEIGRLGKFYAQNGMGTDDALDQAKERFLATHTEVGGNFIYTAGKDIPPNFGALATNAIEQYAKDFGESEGVEAGDLTIRPATNGQGWMIVHRNGQFPVENSARASLSLRSLYQMDQERQQLEKQKVIDQQRNEQLQRHGWPQDNVVKPNFQ